MARRSPRAQALFQFTLFCGILVFVNILANTFYGRLDLTEEKRFTLTRPTRELLKSLDDRIYVEVLLDGEFPAGFKRLQTAAREMLQSFRNQNGLLEFRFENPVQEGTLDEIQARRKALADQGIVPINLRVSEESGSSQQLVYPIAVFNLGTRRIPVNLLENNSPTLAPEEAINNSVTLMEYKFANAIKKILSPDRKSILFAKGHGELDPLQTADLERSLRQFYNIDRIALDSTISIDPAKCALLVIAKPQAAFQEKEKFVIDQYVMNGGSVLWLIDRMAASLDSLRNQRLFVPQDYPLNLEDMLFKYGARIQPDLILDLESTRIPLYSGQAGNAPQFQLTKWFYHPAVRPVGNHPIVKNLDRVELKFASSIDTIRTKTPVQKTVVLKTSPYSRLQFSPVEVRFDEVMRDDPGLFNKGPQVVGVLLEGIFASAYENRVSEEMLGGLEQAGVKFRSSSDPTRMLVISDGDVAANPVRNRASQEWLPLGFNDFEKATYANRELMLNAIEYLIDPTGVIEARTKEVKLRLLDTVRTKKEKTLWQLINIGAPLVLLGIFGAIFIWRRKRLYARG